MYMVCYVHIEKEQDGDRCPKGTEKERNIDKKRERDRAKRWRDRETYRLTQT